MNPVASHAIDIAESAYNLDKPSSVWLRDLIDVGAPVLRPRSSGCSPSTTFSHRARVARARTIVIHSPHAPNAARRTFPPEVVAERSERPCRLRVVSTRSSRLRVTRAPGLRSASRNYPEVAASASRSRNPRLPGVYFAVLADGPQRPRRRDHRRPSDPATQDSTPKAQERWQMLGAHIATAHRFRHASGTQRGQQSVRCSRRPGCPRQRRGADRRPAAFESSTLAGPASEPSCARQSCARLRAACRPARVGNLRKARSGARTRDVDRPGRAAVGASSTGSMPMAGASSSPCRIPPALRDPRGLTEQECTGRHVRGPRARRTSSSPIVLVVPKRGSPGY